MKAIPSELVPISSQENDHILDYIKSHNAAVLTIMFTDIVGFTELTERKGDLLASKLHLEHDQMLCDIIENQHSGLVIKYIGDSVMAIFSEPSVAVETALTIQTNIKKIKVDEDQLSIRIGLHIGQVSVENDMQIDIFGRHVNRASRIEHLAVGGQILMSHSVFDSACGWLKSQPNIAWQDHGFYKLKGIQEKVNIFEVYLPSRSSPLKPKNGAVYKVSYSYILIFIILICSLFTHSLYNEYVVPKISFTYQPSQQLRVIDDEMNDTIADLDIEKSNLNKKLDRGVYLFYFPISKFERQYQVAEINYGINKLNNDYKSWSLPRIKFNKSTEGMSQYSDEFVVIYWVNGEVKLTDFNLSLNIEKVNSSINFSIQTDKSGNIERFNKQIVLSDKRVWHFSDEVIWQDSLFELTLKSYQSNGTLKGELVGQFK